MFVFIWNDEYDWLAWLRCKVGIHTPRLYYRHTSMGRMHYWKCLHCPKIHSGGIMNTYFLNESNYGDYNLDISSKQIHDILAHFPESPGTPVVGSAAAQFIQSRNNS